MDNDIFVIGTILDNILTIYVVKAASSKDAVLMFSPSEGVIVHFDEEAQKLFEINTSEIVFGSESVVEVQRTRITGEQWSALFIL